jgi:hypothetical protein
MEKIAFIGSYDKADMLLYIAKIISIMGKKVILIDASALQKTRYIIPTMQAEKQYITTFENVDVAIGFQTLDEIKKYKGLGDKEELEYDYALLDIDSYRGYYYFGVKQETPKYFITSLDLYSLRRGLQVFRRLEAPVDVTKILFTKEIRKEENEYLNHLSKGLKIKWNEDIIYFPFESGDQDIIYSNQRTGRIRIKGLSTQYIDGILYIVEGITGASQGEVSKASKILERN